MKIVVYSTKTGKSPFHDWQKKLDATARSVIRTRLDRIRLGNFGDSKIIKGGEGIWELRIDFGPGFRIYFGRKGSTVIVLLVGGSKSSQDRDIEKAKRYWLECKDLTDE